MAGKNVQPKDRVRTVTVDGVDITVDPAIFDNYEMMESLYDLQHAGEDEQNAFALVPFLRTLCGDAYPKVKKVLRDPETGRIPLEKVGEFVTTLMNELAPNS